MDEIRPATLDDVEVLARLDRLCFPASWSEQMFRSLLASPTYTAFVIEDRAFALWSSLAPGPAGTECELLRLGVHPGARNRGLGRALVECQIARLEGPGSEIYLEVRPSNVAAVRLYGRLGFAEVGRRASYYQDGEDALLMRYRRQKEIVYEDS